MEPPASVTSAVIERARLGDHAALSVLFRTYQPALLRYFRGRLPDVAEDLAAQTWLDAGRNIGAFAGGPDDFRRWLFAIARRRVQDDLRRRSRRPEQLSARPPETVIADDAFEAADELERALALVRQLSPDQADAVLLRIVADMDVGQVAEVMGRSEGAVRVLVHRGLQRLRDLVSRAARIMV